MVSIVEIVNIVGDVGSVYPVNGFLENTVVPFVSMLRLVTLSQTNLRSGAKEH